jgi:hypothetical protein
MLLVSPACAIAMRSPDVTAGWPTTAAPLSMLDHRLSCSPTTRKLIGLVSIVSILA